MGESGVSAALNRIKLIIGKSISNAIDDEVPLHGAAIAFYTIFSVAPLFIIVLSISQYLLSGDLVRQKLYTIVADYTGPQMASSIQTLVEAYSNTASNTFTYIIALVMLIFGATTAITQLKASLNTIWNVPEEDKHFIFKYLLDRSISFLVIIIITGLFVGVLLLEAVSPVITSFFHTLLPEFITSFLFLGLPLSSALMTLLFFYILLRILPDTTIPRKDVFVGALFTTLLFLIGKYLLALYLGNSSVQLAYRAAGSFVVFLIWVYYNIQIFLFGAEFTGVYANRHKLEGYK
ncbi:YihY/virulence factor BrkB family protein [Balneolaceae bacterium YR4-1]|uniref:YihY/virulence factor BrkB family protein n=1 Tax=Halalkalibaculum roseum TaxID=2709311 RepID=A0A6M1T0E7_9BACT|nr:YihY/virulence factor BrkB family protein [Halalkalibaculum roseum]NGP76964.1 YihY/virulence factor BrkB family protein [Halalkalibaculum roseum]